MWRESSQFIRSSTTDCGIPSPPLARGGPANHLGNARARGRRSIGWERIKREEAVGDNLVVGSGDCRLTERAHHEQRHVVAPGYPFVEEHSTQVRRIRQLNISLLVELARERREQRLTRLHTAAGQVPPADIAVLEEKDAPLTVDHHG